MIQVVLTDNEALLGAAYKASVKFFEDGGAYTPSSPVQITFYTPENSQLWTDVLVASSGEVSFEIPATYISEAAENYRLVVDVEDIHVTFFVDVVKYKLYCNVTDEDLKNYHPQIMAEIWASETSYTTQIQEAFYLVKQDLKRKGMRPYLIIDASQVRELIILKALTLIFFDFADTNNVWQWRYEEVKTLYDEKLGSLPLRYEAVSDDEDSISTVEDRIGFQPEFKR